MHNLGAFTVSAIFPSYGGGNSGSKRFVNIAGGLEVSLASVLHPTALEVLEADSVGSAGYVRDAVDSGVV